jgi:ubiquinone/menaquinone biosynthesis C-methylase UbiE
MVVSLSLLAFNFLLFVALDVWRSSPTQSEGFQDKEVELYTWTTDPLQIYDSFYAKTYDLLTQNVARTKSKLLLSMDYWKRDKTDHSTWSVLDAGCGTGLGTIELANEGVGNIISIDISPSMISQAMKNIEDLPKEQQDKITFRKDTLLNPSACSPEEVNHIICYYFTIYYMEDIESFFRNCYLWSKEGGTLHVEVVNKHKFDPILDSANPLMGFSMQKYFKERVRKSKVTFTTFDYEGEFMLMDPKAEFRETFRFKTSKVRRQKHIFYMPDIKEITDIANTVGWKYQGYIDLTTVGFEYGYILMFKKEGRF